MCDKIRDSWPSPLLGQDLGCLDRDVSYDDGENHLHRRPRQISCEAKMDSFLSQGKNGVNYGEINEMAALMAVWIVLPTAPEQAMME